MLEFVEGGWIFEGCGPPGGIGEAKARQYLRDVVAGLMYLHEHVQLTYNKAFFMALGSLVTSLCRW